MREGSLKPTRPRRSCQTDVLKPLAEFNRGAALLEQYQYARAAEKFQSVLTAFPAWTAARFNLGLALLNLPDAPDALDRAEAEFERVIAVEPDHRWAHFCLGVLYQHKGDFDKALDHFGKVHGSDPDDPFVGFEYVETLRKLDRNPEALRVLEKVIERDPGFVSAFYSLGMLYNRMRQRDKAIQVLKRFGELKPQELAVGSYGVVEPYAGRGKYFTALAADGLPVAASAMSPAPRVLFSPDVKNIDSPLASWTWAGSKVNVPGVAVGDVDADGDQDVVLAGVGALGGTAVVFNDGKDNFKTGPRLADKTVVPCLGDIDNDGDLDLWLGRAGRDLLLLGDGKGKFTQAPAQPEPGGAHLTTCARLADLDSDGDLDLLAMRIKAGSVPPQETQAATASRLFNNNLDGTFADLAPAHGLALADLPVSAVVLDDFDKRLRTVRVGRLLIPDGPFHSWP
ncbi:MAG: tetratricopeptide repeat protein [Isosphaeraceae bacterium]